MNAPAGQAGTVNTIVRALTQDIALLRLSTRRLVRDAMERYRCSCHLALAAVTKAKRLQTKGEGND